MKTKTKKTMKSVAKLAMKNRPKVAMKAKTIVPDMRNEVATLATNSSAKPPKASAKGTPERVPERAPVTRGKSYASVIEALRDIFPEDSEFIDSIEQQRVARRVVRNLEYMRLVQNVSQAEVAQVLGCQQARVSKIESGYDADLTLRILEGYAIATGFELELTFRGEGRTLVDDIEEYLKRIEGYLGRIVELADRDETIVRGTMQTHVRTMQSAWAMVRESAIELPRLQDDPQPLRVAMVRANLGNVENGTADNGHAPRKRMADVKRKTRREN